MRCDLSCGDEWSMTKPVRQPEMALTVEESKRAESFVEEMQNRILESLEAPEHQAEVDLQIWKAPESHLPGRLAQPQY